MCSSQIRFRIHEDGTKCDNPLIGLLNIRRKTLKEAEVKEANLLLKQSGLNYYGSMKEQYRRRCCGC